jgi:hypothetical protein
MSPSRPEFRRLFVPIFGICGAGLIWAIILRWLPLRLEVAILLGRISIVVMFAAILAVAHYGSKEPPGRFQFRLRTLFWITAVVAVSCVVGPLMWRALPPVARMFFYPSEQNMFEFLEETEPEEIRELRKRIPSRPSQFTTAAAPTN